MNLQVSAIGTGMGLLLRPLALCAPLAMVLPASAAPITWTAQPVPQSDLSLPADQSVVSTTGTLVAAVNVGGLATTVNGVDFEAGNYNLNTSKFYWFVPNVQWGASVGGFYATDGSTLGNAANSWLNSGQYTTSTTATAQLGMLDLTIGHQYEVQMFFTDNRTIYAVDGRTVSLDGGTTRDQYAYAPSGGPYGYLTMTGTFTADSTTQTVNMLNYAPAGGAAIGGQINAFQFRDLGLPAVTQPVTFSPAGGNYIGAQSVTLSCITAGATIYYTTDGSPPTVASSSGASGLTVNVPAASTTTIKAYAVSAGNSDSGETSATYTTQATTSGIWTNTAGGSWDVTGNWQANAIPFAGTGDFSTLALSADTNVTVDGTQTIGHLIFGDTGATYNWQISPGSGDPLTLNTGSTASSITVNNQTTTIAAVLAGTRGMTKEGDGILALTGANTYTGTTTVNTGLLRVTDLASHRSNVAIASGATFEANVAADVNAPNSFNITGTGTAVKTGAGLWLIGNVGRVGISMSPGGLLDIQAGTVGTGSHQQSFSGNQGSINIAAGATLDISAENVWADALTGGGSIIMSYTLSGARTVTVGVADSSGTFSGAIGSASFIALDKAGTGTQILTGANTYTNTTTISDGTLQLGDGGTTGSLSPGSAITTHGTLAFNRSDDVSQGVDFGSSAIGGTGGLTQMGPGTLTLTANNSYSGATVVAGGKLAAAPAPGSIWNVTDLDLADGTTLSLQNFDSSSGNPAASASGSLTTAGTVTIEVDGTFEVGTFPLIWYPVGGSIGGAGYAALTLAPLPNGVLGHLVNNSGDSSVDLVIDSVPGYAAWIAGFTFEPGADTTPTGDPDHDGLENGVEMVVGGDPTVMDVSLSPTLELVTTDLGSGATDYLLFTYRRTDLSVTASVISAAKYGTDLIGWTTAVDGVDGVVIQVDDNHTFTPPAPDTDRVRVYIPRGANTTLFGRLDATVP